MQESYVLKANSIRNIFKGTALLKLTGKRYLNVSVSKILFNNLLKKDSKMKPGKNS